MKANGYQWISIDDMIEMLQKEKENHGGDGTVPLCINGLSWFYLDSLPYYYDGGYCMHKEGNRLDVYSSRDGQTIREGFPKDRIDIRGTGPDYDEEVTYNERSIVDCDPDSWVFMDKLEQEERKKFGGQIVQYKGVPEYNKLFDCYPFMAYLDSGESAIGRSRAEAKANLLAVYEEKHKEENT